ncbi:DUF2795 domain-containing protein [Saccharothrix coeruleofusca]|uniref:DUF2795 domain-containing protein n=1 Tax=Saccharothrix coeruleofusca TaxID=33919 RepID=A0A918ATG4_9PSEU|nr:DUF2795 domain-containing protein [Saccharothrix coeruleofusca]MBP2336903.1 hypothetical protein [Saccharothrix coeruleofusca]GGP81997.1 hypothetical protein GCM10010185_65060 [Saccharothrix coeruleofusca]
MSDTTTVDRLRTGLRDVRYPAEKGQLVDHASRNNSDEDTVHALHSIPEKLYGSFEEVLRAVPVDQSRES